MPATGRTPDTLVMAIHGCNGEPWVLRQDTAYGQTQYYSTRPIDPEVARLLVEHGHPVIGVRIEQRGSHRGFTAITYAGPNPARLYVCAHVCEVYP